MVKGPTFPHLLTEHIGTAPMRNPYFRDRPPSRKSKGGQASVQDRIDVPDRRELADGDLLFAEGDPSGCAYFVESGVLEIFVIRDGLERDLGRATPGEIVGEMGVIDRKPRSASARALGPTAVLTVKAEVLEQMVESCPPGLRQLLATLMERLRKSAE